MRIVSDVYRQISKSKHNDWKDFYSGSHTSSVGGTIGGIVSISRCVFQNLESHAIYCETQNSNILIESCLFHHITSDTNGGAFSFYCGESSFIVLNKICIYKTCGEGTGNAFESQWSPFRSYLISITKCDEKTDTQDTIAIYYAYTCLKNTNISYCSSTIGRYYIAAPTYMGDEVFKFGTFVENNSPSYCIYHHYYNSHDISFCTFVQKNYNGYIMDYTAYHDSDTLNISDSVFILNPNNHDIFNPNYYSPESIHFFNCNMNGENYDDIPNICFNIFVIDQCMLITRSINRNRCLNPFFAILQFA